MSSTGFRYRTAEDVRAIPNEQWEAWLRSGVPFYRFAASRECQCALRAVLKATRRRMSAVHESGQTCPRCGDLTPFGRVVCGSCGCALQLARDYGGGAVGGAGRTRAGTS